MLVLKNQSHFVASYVPWICEKTLLRKSKLEGVVSLVITDENDIFICLVFREHAKNFKEEDMQKRIEGKNCIVTGANSGIGYATVEALASRY